MKKIYQYIRFFLYTSSCQWAEGWGMGWGRPFKGCLKICGPFWCLSDWRSFWFIRYWTEMLNILQCTGQFLSTKKWAAQNVCSFPTEKHWALMFGSTVLLANFSYFHHHAWNWASSICTCSLLKKYLVNILNIWYYFYIDHLWSL